MTLFSEKPSLLRPMKTWLEPLGRSTITPVWRHAHRSAAPSYMMPADHVTLRSSNFSKRPLSKKRKSRSLLPSENETCCLLTSSWSYAA